MSEPVRLSIKETADLLGISTSKLRYWEQEGLISSRRDTSNNYRTFSLHELIEAGDILFYRSLGVPLEALKGYRKVSLGELEDILAQAQNTTERKIAELQETRLRLIEQRRFYETGRNLLSAQLKPGIPDFARFEPVNYSSREQLEYLVRNPQSFGLVVEADHPSVMREICVDYPGDSFSEEDEFNTDIHVKENHSSLTWSFDKKSHTEFLECMVVVNEESQEIDVEYLFDESRKLGYLPYRIMGRFLTTAMNEVRQDYYHAWIECSKA